MCKEIKMKKILVVMLASLVLSGCSMVNNAAKSIAKAIAVETFNTKNNEGKEDWTVVKLELEGEGTASMFAYKTNASIPSKMGAANIGNYYSDALLYPEEVNYIAVTYRNGSKSGQYILNNIEGVKNKKYIVKVSGGSNKFKVALVDAETQTPVPFKKTMTP